MLTHRLTPLVLALVLIPLPIIGWSAVQAPEERILRNSEYTGALVQTLSASTFAVILLLSALTNALVVSLRYRDSPSSYRPSRYLLWQSILIVLVLAWVVVVTLNYLFNYVETALGVAIAIVSIVVCVLASKRDAESVARRDARRARRSPAVNRGLRRAAVIAPAAVLAIAVAGIAIASNVTVVHRDCMIAGTGTINDRHEFSTENCGQFALDDSELSFDEVSERFYAHEPVDITTRGFRILPWQAIAIGVEDAE